MKKSFKFFYLLLVLPILFYGCSDDPTSAGYNLLPNGDLIGAYSFDTDSTSISITSSYFLDSLNLSDSDKLLIGKNASATSHALIKFFTSIPDSISDQIEKDSIIVKKCWIEVVPNYFLGEVTNPFGIEIFGIKEDWNSTDINRDNFSSLSVDRTTNLISNLNFTDSLITFDINKEIAQKWIENTVDSTKGENFGILLSPTSSTNLIIGIPGLTSSYDTDNFIVYMEVEKLGKYLDTLISATTEDVHVVEYTIPTSNNANMILMGGAVYRSQMYFDLSSLPKNIAINKAILTLSIDETESFVGTPESDSIFAIILDDSTAHDINSYYDISIMTKFGSKFTGDITAFVQRWVDGLSNQGIRFNLSDEANSINRLAIGSQKSTANKPNLKIYYTNRQ